MERHMASFSPIFVILVLSFSKQGGPLIKLHSMVKETLRISHMYFKVCHLCELV